VQAPELFDGTHALDALNTMRSVLLGPLGTENISINSELNKTFKG
jgi:hypothetical protein